MTCRTTRQCSVVLFSPHNPFTTNQVTNLSLIPRWVSGNEGQQNNKVWTILVVSQHAVKFSDVSQMLTFARLSSFLWKFPFTQRKVCE